MFWKPFKVQPAPEPGKEVKEPKRRFQIVKLEERIAPCAYKYRGRTVHYPGPCGGHKK